MDDRELVALLRQRAQGSVDTLLLRHGPLMRYIIAPILEDPREREECLSDVTMLVWENIGRYEGDKGSFAAWLSALTRNAARNRRRGLRRHEGGEELHEGLADPAPGPEEVLLHKERSQRLRQALAGLSGQEQTLFYRKYYYMQSTAQIAAEMGLTERAVEGRLRRLRLRLRKELGGELV